MSSIYYKTSAPTVPFVEIQPLESNGPGNLSTPRQIVDVEFLDKSFTTPTDAFVINDDVSTRFVQGFSFSVIGGSPYDGVYTVNAGVGFVAGSVVAQVVGGHTHIPVTAIIDAANPHVYAFTVGFTTPSISPTTPGNYLVTWQLAGDQTAVFVANSQVQFKHIVYNDNVTNARVNRTYTVQSSTYNPLGFTNVVTTLTNETPTSLTPVIGVDAQSVVVFPIPAVAPYGYVQYTVPTIASSLNLVGRGCVMYDGNTTWGEAIQGNILHVMENFANTTPPVSQMDGQLWFDTTTGPTTGPALRLWDTTRWYGVVAEGMPVQGNLNMNNYTIASVKDAVTTYPYVPSLTAWGNNDQEVMNLRTSDGLYIAKTGGYDTNLAHRSGTMSGSLSVTPYIEGRETLTTSVGTTGILRLGATAQVGMSLKSNDSSFAYLDFVNATAQRTNVTYTFGTHLLEFGKYLDEVVGPAAGSINFSTGQFLTKKTTFTDNQELITKLFADTSYVNVTGDTMSGTLAMSGAANVTLASGNVTLASGDVILGTGNNTVSIQNNGTAAGSIVFNTTGATTTTGNVVLDLGGNVISGLSNAVNATDAVSLQFADGRYVNVAGDTMTGDLILNANPSVALGAATKQYVDMFASGIIWLSPIVDQSLFDDTLTTPPVDDGYLAYHKSFIVAAGGTGAWAGKDGRLMFYNGTGWIDMLNRPIAVGDRIGVFMEPAQGDPHVNLPGGGLAGQAGKIATVTSVSPFVYTFYTPAEPDAVTVVGVNDPLATQSPHMGHSYTFRGTYGVGAYGTAYSWIEFLGPQSLIAGTGLQFNGNTLSTNGNVLSLYNLASNGLVVHDAAGSVVARQITGAAGEITITNSDGVLGNPSVGITPTGVAAGTYSTVTVDATGRVTAGSALSASSLPANGYDSTYVNVSGDTMTGALVLNADPTVALGAATKQYVDNSPGALISVPMGTAATPNLFPLGVTGLDAYGSPDMPEGATFWTGFTVAGAIANTYANRAMQLVANWDDNGTGVVPQHVNVRVNDDTHDVTTWSNWRKLAWLDEVVSLTGGTMTGSLTLNADPTIALHAATKQYVDTARVMALAASVNGTVPASAKVLMTITAQPFIIDATPSASPSYGYADTASTGSAVFDIRKNGISIGSMVFSAGVNAASFTFASAVTFAAGDRLAVVAPGTADTTLADVYFTIRGTLV